MRGASIENARTLPRWGVPSSMSSTSTSAMVRLILTCCEQQTLGVVARITSTARSDDETASVRTHDRHLDRRTLTDEGGLCQAVRSPASRTPRESMPVKIPIDLRCQLNIVRRKVLCQPCSDLGIHWRRIAAVIGYKGHFHPRVDAKARCDA